MTSSARDARDQDGAAAGDQTVSLSDIAEIELFILKRMREFTLGDHASVFKGAGFNFVGTREWAPGDRLSTIDWAQSTLTNFTPMITRDFEQDSNATIVAVADASLSTRCGAYGATIGVAIARALAAAGLSAVFFQDLFGVITFGDTLRPIVTAPPRIGRSHVIHCVDLYQQSGREAPLDALPASRVDRGIIGAVQGQLRKASLVPVISDFLFADVARLIGELALLNAVHDVFLVMADVRFAYELPYVSAGWIDAFDIETGQTRVVSRRELNRLAGRVDAWQQDVMRLARDADLDVVRVGLDRWEMETALMEFAAERRLRKI
jgi:uncharacterized protein (DUF58 family)